MTPPPFNPQDRLYSLDSTAPVDYVPEGTIDFAAASLTEIADYFKTDKGNIKHNYTSVYESYLKPLRHTPGLRLLEIGVACGSSLKTWSRYFANSSHIVGVDIREQCSTLCKGYPNIEIRISNATKVRQAGEFDVIIDDATHVSADIVDIFHLHWPAVKPGGFYFIEDLKCTHNPDYPRQISFPIPPERFDRQIFMSFVDGLLKEMDWRRGDIEFLHFTKELLAIKKKA